MSAEKEYMIEQVERLWSAVAFATDADWEFGRAFCWQQHAHALEKHLKDNLGVQYIHDVAEWVEM